MSNPYGKLVTPLERIKAKLAPEGDCLLWTGYTNVISGNPYGYVKVNGVQKLAHRAIWELTKGPIERGIDIGRKCRNSLCCNVDHMFLFPHKCKGWTLTETPPTADAQTP